MFLVVLYLQEQYDRGDGDGNIGAQPLYLGCRVTMDQARVLILSFIFKHHISGDGLNDLMKLFNVLFPGILPKSKYMFSKAFTENTEIVLTHIFCSECVSYFGTKTD